MKPFGHTVPHLLNVIYESLVKILKSFSLNLRVENTNQDQGLFGSLSLKASNFALREASMITGLSMYVLFSFRLSPRISPLEGVVCRGQVKCDGISSKRRP